MYLCPLCRQSLRLHLSAKSYECSNHHCFDVAKEGYVNLLPVHHKNSKEPGDNKRMITARCGFLAAGFFEPLATAVALMIATHRAELPDFRLLDCGCGEGYYTRMLEQHNQEQLNLHGLDINKFAIALAAKKQPKARFVVASAKHIPYPDHYFDALLRIFAPSYDAELRRILKPAGLLLTVTPGPLHLWQLKKLIYTEPKEHLLEAVLPYGFERLESQRIANEINLDSEQCLTLLQMTPFAFRADEGVQLAIKEMGAITITTDFILTLAHPVELH